MRSWRAITCCMMGAVWWCTPVNAAISIEIQGVGEALRANVEAYLGIATYRELPNLSEITVRRLHAQAPEEIRAALAPYGFYHPQIESRLTQTADGWQATYQITPGPPIHIQEVHVALSGAGANDPAFGAVYAQLPVHRGTILNHSAYATAKENLLLTAIEQGYLDAQYRQHELRVNTDTNTAVIVLALDTGPRYAFGPLHFEQENALEAMDEPFLRRYITFEPGEPFSTRELRELQYALVDSQFFSVVEVMPQRAQVDAQHRVPIVVKLEPRSKHQYRAGLGYGTDTGPRLSLGWINRRVNQRGHRAEVQLQFSEVEDSFNARYFVPLYNPANDQIVYSLGAKESELGDTISEKQNIGIARTTLEGVWQQTAYLQFERERSIVPLQAETNTRLVLPGITWSRIEADNIIVPSHGWRLLFDVRGTHRKLSSTSSFAQTRIQAEWITSFGEQMRLLTRFDAGYSNVDETSELPLSQRFFAGGDQSVRGYAYNELAPADADGNIIGGRHLLVGSVELERRFKGEWSNWGLAAFYDTGTAMNEWGAPLHSGAGIGLRWKSPVGMVRVDVARPLDNDATGWRLHLSIGPDL